MSEQVSQPESEEMISWQAYVRVTVLCLAFLLTALAVNPVSAPAAVLIFVAAFVAGIWFPLQETAGELAEGGLDVDFLMILVALGAFALGHPSEGAALLVLFNGSRAMEAYARKRTHTSIKDLVAELPSRAVRLRGDEQEEIPLAEVRRGDQLLVRPGDRFPVDCAIVEGSGTLDLSAITGESEPVEIRPGREVPSGAINGRGRVVVEALRPASESAWQKIIQLIESAPARRSPAQILSDRVGRWFTVAILSASITGFLVWWLIVGLSFSEAGYRAMVLLVAGSPCAVVLSIPSAILAAISSGARRGVLFNGGAGLSRLNHVRLAAFDKTGTLTTGQSTVSETALVREGEEDEKQVFAALALALARSSTHPASGAVCHYLGDKEGLPEVEVDEIEEIAGQGVRGTWQGQTIRLGRPQGCEALQEDEPALSKIVFTLSGNPRMRFYLSETPRMGAAETISALHKRGLKTMMISGDARPAVAHLAEIVGIDDARGELRPEEKWRIIQDASAAGGVMMVGDGVNDAPALSVADVAVAMGIRGSAATLAEADLVLVRDNLPDLVSAFDLAKRTQAIIRQNLFLSIGAATLLVAFAIAGSLPLLLGVFGHEGGTVLVVLNSLRLLALRSRVPAYSQLDPIGGNTSLAY